MAKDTIASLRNELDQLTARVKELEDLVSKSELRGNSSATTETSIEIIANSEPRISNFAMLRSVIQLQVGDCCRLNAPGHPLHGRKFTIVAIQGDGKYIIRRGAGGQLVVSVEQLSSC